MNSQLADPGIQEDKNVIIYLDLGILRFSTDHLLCASNKDCKDGKRMAEIRKKLGINRPGEKEEDSPKPEARSNLDFLMEDKKVMILLNESTILNGTMGGGNQ